MKDKSKEIEKQLNRNLEKIKKDLYSLEKRIDFVSNAKFKGEQPKHTLFDRIKSWVR